MSLRCLISTHHLQMWSGSEIVAIELAEELISSGCKVDLFAPYQNPDFVRTEMPSHASVRSSSERLDLRSYDLVYSQHQTLSRLLASQDVNWLYGSERPYFLFNHLSPLEPFEFPGPFVENDIADEIWCNSIETYQMLRSRYGVRYAGATVVPNPSPAMFERRAAPLGTARLRRVLSVSNHLPPELAEAFDLLRREGVEVQRLGQPDTMRRISASDVHSTDAVVTIGKTVQYALRARVPVFCYDCFGGPGWLDAANFEPSARVNFSGRNEMGAKTAEAIAGLIQADFDKAAAFSANLPSKRIQHFEFERHIAGLLDRVAERRSNPKPLANQAVGPVDQAAQISRWAQEAALYGLIDRHYIAEQQQRTIVAEQRRRLLSLQTVRKASDNMTEVPGRKMQ